MYALRKNLEQIWDQLRSQKPSRRNSLEEVQVRGLRGIQDLRVPLPFPVCVLAGANGCGKSTVLLALACAYRPVDESVGKTPARVFPAFRPVTSGGEPSLSDERSEAEMVFSYVADNERCQMRWGRTKKGWNRSFFGRKGRSQPARYVLLRTLANLTNPSEVRSVLQLSRGEYATTAIDASNITFAQRILNYRYSTLTLITKGLRSILFARRSTNEVSEGEPRYSEFHMSAGERAVIRLSMDISKQEDMLVLIDEIEAGLHPYVQQLLMLELQRLALRNQLQIIVTTHSPAVLETVPSEARLFLERTEQNVVRREPYRDLIQKALYGRSQNTLSVLCEDEEAEMFVRGVLDAIGPEIDILQSDLEIGRDTGKDQFPAHLETLARFRKLGDVLFVLDGDGRAVGNKMLHRAEAVGQAARIVYLPGGCPPEVWAWGVLGQHCGEYAKLLGLTEDRLRTSMEEHENLYAAAVDQPSAIAKNKLAALAGSINQTLGYVLRLLGRNETEKKRGDVFELANTVRETISQWRSASS